MTAQWAPAMARAGSGDSRHFWLVARQDVDYVAQLTHRLERHAVRTAPVALGGSSMTLGTEIFDPQDQRVFARGRTVLVCADSELRPVQLPETIRQRLTPHLIG